MTYYAGLDLSMETTQVCIVNETGRNIAAMKVESSPDMIANALREVGGVERAVIETGRMSPAICHGLRALDIPIVCIDARQANQACVRQSTTQTVRWRLLPAMQLRHKELDLSNEEMRFEATEFRLGRGGSTATVLAAQFPIPNAIAADEQEQSPEGPFYSRRRDGSWLPAGAVA